MRVTSGPVKSMCQSNETGFTLVEILLVMAITSILAGFAVVSLIRPQLTANLSTTTDMLVADIKSQQQKSMASEGAQSHGIKIEANRYILFSGVAYDEFDTQNFAVDYGGGVAAITNIPSSEVIFRPGSGELTVYDPSNNTITLHHPQAEDSHEIEINPYGVVTVTR